MKTILITGASGFVGRYLAKVLLDQNNAVIGLGTSSAHPFEQIYDAFTWISADTGLPGPWQNRVQEADVIINLAGRNIFNPWTRAYKKAIYDSRVKTTQNLVAALPNAWSGLFFSASAAGYYGDRGDTPLSETDLCGTDFLAMVCRDWEARAQSAAQKGARVLVMRFGVVLGQGGGALNLMGKAFKCFVGGPLGSGRQWFPWIHIQDLCQAVLFLLSGEHQGVFNFTGPVATRQKAFAHALGSALKRPAFMPAPAMMVKFFLGELGASLLQSQKALPVALEKSGFKFGYRTVKEALDSIYSPLV
ncbi:MAG: TIGR01777 family protein [Desulfobacter sp.]|nr:MAG: TIGR01777 family protein [Desulfobacter sp.]